MCGVCGLPSTHVNTIQTISLIPIFLLVFTTFFWAWWIVTRIRIENYFLNKFVKICSYCKRVKEYFHPHQG